MVYVMEFLSNPENSWLWSVLQSFLVLVGFALVIRQMRLARDQNSISHLNFFRELWNSEAVLRARMVMAEESVLEASDFDAAEDVIATFMEDLAAAVRVGQVNKEHLWSYFSFFIEGYWLMLEPKIKFYQKKTSDPTYFRGYHDLYRLSGRISRQKGGFPMLESYVAFFREEESIYVRFLLDKPSRDALIN